MLLAFCNCHYGFPSTALWATAFCTSHYEVFPQPSVQLIFCTCNSEDHSTAICATDILYLSLWNSFHSSVCYSLAVLVVKKFLPNFCVLKIFCTCYYEGLSTALCATNIPYLSIWSSFHSSLCYYHSAHIFKYIHELLCELYLFRTCHHEVFSTALCVSDIL